MFSRRGFLSLLASAAVVPIAAKIPVAAATASEAGAAPTYAFMDGYFFYADGFGSVRWSAAESLSSWVTSELDRNLWRVPYA